MKLKHVFTPLTAFSVTVAICTAQEPSPSPSPQQLKEITINEQPHVSLVVPESSPFPGPGRIGVSVIGYVPKQGAFSLPVGAGILDALERAGGMNAYARRVHLIRVNSHGDNKVIRRFTSEQIAAHAFKDVKLKDQDTIRVLREPHALAEPCG